MKRKIIIITISLLITGLALPEAEAVSLRERLSGRILLQVESRGEAWYVCPESRLRYYLGRPADAFAAMHGLGTGISDIDLKKIAVGLAALSGADSDSDGLPDRLETALGTDPQKADTDGDGFSDYEEARRGYDPAGPGRLPLDPFFAARLTGRIFLQVESRGEAWYINPADNKRYFLGRPEDALAVMRRLGLGITNADLGEIPSARPVYETSTFARQLHERVNEERLKAGLQALKWNEELARIAEEHSRDLACENEALTGLDRACDYPLIHHEGFSFGLYSRDRSNSRGIYYFSRTGENIALVSGASVTIKLPLSLDQKKALDGCPALRDKAEKEFSAGLERAADGETKKRLAAAEIETRQALFAAEPAVRVADISWLAEEELVARTVRGWIDSPGHRANLLDEKYDEAGLGAAVANGYVISTQVFITRSACGYFNGPCCEEAGYYPYCYEPYSCANGLCAG